MAKARRQTKTTTDTILRKLEDARQQFERTFERAIKADGRTAGYYLWLGIALVFFALAAAACGAPRPACSINRE